MCILIIRSWPSCGHMRCTSSEKCQHCLSTPGMTEYECPNVENVFPEQEPDWPCVQCSVRRVEGERPVIGEEVRGWGEVDESEIPGPWNRGLGDTQTLSGDTLVPSTPTELYSPAWVEEWVQTQTRGDQESRPTSREEFLERYQYGMGQPQTSSLDANSVIGRYQYGMGQGQASSLRANSVVDEHQHDVGQEQRQTSSLGASSANQNSTNQRPGDDEDDEDQWELEEALRREFVRQTKRDLDRQDRASR